MSERFRNQGDLEAFDYILGGGCAAVFNGVYYEHALSETEQIQASLGRDIRTMSGVWDRCYKKYAVSDRLLAVAKQQWERLSRGTTNDWQRNLLFRMQTFCMTNPLNQDRPSTINISPYLSLPIVEAVLQSDPNEVIFHRAFKDVFKEVFPSLSRIPNPDWNVSCHHSVFVTLLARKLTSLSDLIQGYLGSYQGENNYKIIQDDVNSESEAELELMYLHKYYRWIHSRYPSISENAETSI